MNVHRPPTDVDRWLTEFFQAELPKPFRTAPVVDAEVVSPGSRRRGTVERGRWTLALSVAALLLLGVSLSYGPVVQTISNSDLLLQGKADGNGTELDKALKRLQSK